MMEPTQRLDAWLGRIGLCKKGSEWPKQPKKESTPSIPRSLITSPLPPIILFKPPVLAWNNYGHMSVAYVAYQRLTPQVRDKVNALLAKNPDFANWVALLPP